MNPTVSLNKFHVPYRPRQGDRVQLQTLQWAGYVVRKDNNRITQNVLDGKFYGRGAVERLEAKG